MKIVVKAAAFAAALFGAGSALAAPALVTTDLNLRAGPGTQYQAVGVLPNGAVVDVIGCTSGYSWCRVNYQGYDGWAASSYLAQQSGNYRNYSSAAASIGIPLIAGIVIGSTFGDDDDYYRDRDYYDRRDFRRDRRDFRRDRRDWRRDVRRERREDRRDNRADRVERRFEERIDRIDPRASRRILPNIYGERGGPGEGAR